MSKEREAFEKLPKIAELLKEAVFDAETGEYVSYWSYKSGYLNGAWHMWQAKAQAVPEGFVLISKNDLKMELCSIRHLNSGEYSKSIIEDCVCNIEAMIEAQEPSSASGCFNEP